jgi:hypothetical protein
MVHSLENALESLGHHIRQREAAKPVKHQSAEVIQLPLWPEPARDVPNSALT